MFASITFWEVTREKPLAINYWNCSSCCSPSEAAVKSKWCNVIWARFKSATIFRQTVIIWIIKRVFRVRWPGKYRRNPTHLRQLYCLEKRRGPIGFVCIPSCSVQWNHQQFEGQRQESIIWSRCAISLQGWINSVHIDERGSTRHDSWFAWI